MTTEIPPNFNDSFLQINSSSFFAFRTKISPPRLPRHTRPLERVMTQLAAVQYYRLAVVQRRVRDTARAPHWLLLHLKRPFMMQKANDSINQVARKMV